MKLLYGNAKERKKNIKIEVMFIKLQKFALICAESDEAVSLYCQHGQG